MIIHKAMTRCRLELPLNSGKRKQARIGSPAGEADVLLTTIRELFYKVQQIRENLVLLRNEIF